MTPKELGYYFPAEWAKHEATWLNYPHNENSWPGKINTIYPAYHLFIKHLADVEIVHINVLDEGMQQNVHNALYAIGTNMENIIFHIFPTNDAWTRDCGPAFLLNRNDKKKKALCKKHGVKLIAWPYTEAITETNLRKYLDEINNKKSSKSEV